MSSRFLWALKIFRSNLSSTGGCYSIFNQYRSVLHKNHTGDNYQNEILCRSFSTSRNQLDLMEFFDDKKNWEKEAIQCGRPWTHEELRIKSTVDLHKLWYVLLKERNVLLTMEAEYKRLHELFPAPERIFKVEESMENLQEIMAERDRAYNYLETGESGEREPYIHMNRMGRMVKRTPSEHHLPRWMNSKFSRRLIGPWINEFRRLEREKLMKESRSKDVNKHRYKKRMMEKFPHLDVEEL
ncbi:large ribosomal subunit protein uL29m-like [Tubulanus polymorphus]|uniref:large ribosomal subunit protein uL29m-like n=1 Tax=Tubulanus polymorphus TaxID=672921 RepID=UPI003DA616C7